MAINSSKKSSPRTLSAESLREIEALAAMSGEDIDFSDIPEVQDWTGARRGLFYRPAQRELTLLVDADVIEWFKRKGSGYQTQMNAVLGEHMGREMRGKAT